MINTACQALLYNIHDVSAIDYAEHADSDLDGRVTPLCHTQGSSGILLDFFDIFRSKF